jgi:TonB family protein
MMRRYLPYVAFSLLLHGCLLLVFAFWKVTQEQQPEQRRVLLEFRRQAPRQPRSAGRSPALLGQAADAAAGLRVPDAGVLALPKPDLRTPQAARARVSAGSAEPVRIERTEKPRLAERGNPPSFPSAAETLQEALSGAAREAAVSSLEPTGAVGGYTQETALEWKGRQRQLLRSPELRFPELLAEKGLEVDVEAAFAVAPNGQVTRVEISRSSGFASVDRTVVQALYNTLFEVSSGEEEDQGRISFHFRLERRP